jgi:hypothetical protein
MGTARIDLIVSVATKKRRRLILMEAQRQPENSVRI